MPPEILAADRLTNFEWTEARLWPQFEALLAADPDALCLVDDDAKSWTRRQIADLARPLMASLAAAGVGRGCRLMFAAKCTAATLAIALAASEQSAICCPYAASLNETDFARLTGVLGHAAHVSMSPDGSLELDVQARDSWSADPRDAEAALIAFTSGSTGKPRAVMHRGEALNYVTRACATIAGLKPGEAILGAIPMDGAAGFTFTIHMALSLGQPLVLIDRWSPQAVLERAARFSCAWTTLVPTQLFTLIEAARGGDWASRLQLRTIAVGGSTMTSQLIEEAETALGATPLRMFGMSECLAHCSNQPGFTPDQRATTDGRRFPASEIITVDPEGVQLALGLRGQAGVKGPSLFLGYAAGLGAGEERLTAEGFYLTGDEITIDEAGFVRVVGRIKDQIIRGGYNIDPAEVEAVLLRHPALAQVVLVAVPDDRLGEQACAVCRLAAGHVEVVLQDLLDVLSEAQVYRRKWPEHLVVVDHMQTLSTGKIDKRAMTLKAVAAVQQRRSSTFTG